MTLQQLIGFSLLAQLVDTFPQFPQLPMFPQMPMFQPMPIFPQILPSPTFPHFPQFTLPPFTLPPPLIGDSLFNRSNIGKDILLLSKVATTIMSGIHASAIIHNNKDIRKIREICIDKKDRKTIIPFKRRKSKKILDKYVRAMVETIGLNELRSELKFQPLPPWKPFNETDTEEMETFANATVEDRYNEQEPKSKDRSLDNKKFTEEQLYTSIAHLEKKIPLIREVFKKEYKELRKHELERKSEDKPKEEPKPKKKSDEEEDDSESDEDYDSDEDSEEKKRKEKKPEKKPEEKSKTEQEKRDEEMIGTYIAEFNAVSQAISTSMRGLFEGDRNCEEERRKKEEKQKKKMKSSEEKEKRKKEETVKNSEQ